MSKELRVENECRGFTAVKEYDRPEKPDLEWTKHPYAQNRPTKFSARFNAYIYLKASVALRRTLASKRLITVATHLRWSLTHFV